MDERGPDVLPACPERMAPLAHPSHPSHLARTPAAGRAGRRRVGEDCRRHRVAAARAAGRPGRWCCRHVAIVALALALAACGSSPRRYHEDDGPPARVPAGLAETPDAQPRAEPLHPFANRPYTVDGRRFVPLGAEAPLRQRGIASWYGRQFHGNPTATGERYDMFEMTAAHPTLPLPSYARVTHLGNGRQVIVRVNDRGPFLRGRVIDLSYAAAYRLGLAAEGSAEVEVERILPHEIRAGTWATASPRRVPAPDPPAATAAGRGWAVQLGAFNVVANAEALRDEVAAALRGGGALDEAASSLRVERDGELWRVLVGRLAERDAAVALAGRLERALGMAAALLPP